jgi:hypothetical protein
MSELAWVARTSRALATVSHLRELSLSVTSVACRVLPKWRAQEKFVAVEHRDQHAERVRSPEVLRAIE